MSKSFIIILNKVRNMSFESQKAWKSDIVKAFKEYWATKPSEQEFGIVMNNIPLFPEIVYHMTQNPVKGVCTCSEKKEKI